MTGDPLEYDPPVVYSVSPSFVDALDSQGRVPLSVFGLNFGDQRHSASSAGYAIACWLLKSGLD